MSLMRADNSRTFIQHIHEPADPGPVCVCSVMHASVCLSACLPVRLPVSLGGGEPVSSLLTNQSHPDAATLSALGSRVCLRLPFPPRRARAPPRQRKRATLANLRSDPACSSSTAFFAGTGAYAFRARRMCNIQRRAIFFLRAFEASLSRSIWLCTN